jgi:PAS domain S-box-containing protein
VALLRHTSIRIKLIAIVMLTTCASLALAGLALVVFEWIIGRRALHREIEAVADIVASTSTATLTFADERTALDTLSKLRAQPRILSGCFYGEDGNLLASYPQAAGPSARVPCPSRVGPDEARFEPNLLVLQRPVFFNGERIGSVRLVTSLAELEQRVQAFGLVLLGTLSAAALVALLVSSRLQRLVSRPVLDLAATASRISEKRDLGLRALKEGRDEIGVAVDAFNQMLDRIEEANQALRQAGDRSREQAELLQSVLDSMGEGLVVAGADGKFLLWNRAASRLLGQGPAELPPPRWPEHYGLYVGERENLFHPEQLPIVRAMRGESVSDVEMYLKPEGDELGRWINISARPLRDGPGSLRGGISVFADVTERRRAEEELRALNATLEQRVAERAAAAEARAQELKRSNEELEQFAYIASHDLQEPLRAVASYTQLLRQRLKGALDAEAQIYADHVLTGVARMRALISGLLDYSRVGRRASELGPVDAGSILDAALSDLEPALKEAGGRFSRGEMPILPADPLQLGQLFRNLVSNAIKFRASEPPTIDVRAQREGEQWRFAVHDNGIGIDAKYHERIFAIFHRLHGWERPGTGIGLAICRKIVEGHGGRIWVESEPDRGSTFIFTLPVGAGGTS